MLQRLSLVVVLLSSIVGLIIYFSFLSSGDAAGSDFSATGTSVYRTPRPTFPPEWRPTIELWPTFLATVLAPHPTKTPVPPTPSSEQKLRLLTEIPAPVQAAGGDVASEIHLNRKTDSIVWHTTSGFHVVKDKTLVDTIPRDFNTIFTHLELNNETGYVYIKFLEGFQDEVLSIFDGTTRVAQFDWFDERFQIRTHPSNSDVYLSGRQSNRSAIEIINGTQIVETVFLDEGYGLGGFAFGESDIIYIKMQQVIDGHKFNSKISIMHNNQIVNSSIAQFNNPFAMFTNEKTDYLYVLGGYDTIDDAEAGLDYFDFTIIQGEEVLLQTDLRDRFPTGQQGRWYILPELSEDHIFLEHRSNDQLIELGYESGELKEFSRINLHDGFSGSKITVDPVRQRLYYSGSDGIYVYDLNQQKVIQTLPTCSLASPLIFNPSTSQIYVACGWTEKLLVFGYE